MGRRGTFIQHTLKYPEQHKHQQKKAKINNLIQVKPRTVNIKNLFTFLFIFLSLHIISLHHTLNYYDFFSHNILHSCVHTLSVCRRTDNFPVLSLYAHISTFGALTNKNQRVIPNLLKSHKK